MGVTFLSLQLLVSYIFTTSCAWSCGVISGYEAAFVSLQEYTMFVTAEKKEVRCSHVSLAPLGRQKYSGRMSRIDLV
jgi:hypothetical protein